MDVLATTTTLSRSFTRRPTAGVFDNRAVYLLKIVGGAWTSLRTMDMDHASINRFWDAVGMPVAV